MQAIGSTQRTQQGGGASSSAGAVSLMIADASASFRRELAAMLSAMGHTVMAQAESGGQALALARSSRPSAALIDVSLAERGPGGESVRALVAERIVPVILLTGGDAETAGAEAGASASSDVWERLNLSGGVFGFLTKPVRRADLGPVIDIALARFQEINALEGEVKSLGERMEARKLVGRAKAILMETQGLSEREAFRRIQAQSAGLKKPPHEIAQAIITASGITREPL